MRAARATFRCRRLDAPGLSYNVLPTVGRGPVPRRASVGEKHWLVCSCRVGRAIAGDRPPRYEQKNVLPTVAREPVPRRASAGEKHWLVCSCRAGRAIAGDRPPRYGLQSRLRFTVGRGPVPRRALGHAGAHPFCRAGSPDPARSGAGAPELQFLLGPPAPKRFFHVNDRGGQAPALR